MKRETVLKALAAFNEAKPFQHVGDCVAATPYAVYSYNTPIVVSASDGNPNIPQLDKVYFNATKYTKTTLQMQNIVLPWLRQHAKVIVIIIDEDRANGSWRLPFGKVREVIYRNV